MRSKWIFVNSTEVVSPFSRATDICAAVFLIILLHLKFVELGNADLLAQAHPTMLDPG